MAITSLGRKVDEGWRLWTNKQQVERQGAGRWEKPSNLIAW